MPEDMAFKRQAPLRAVMAVQYTGEYAEEGEEWPPAAAFADPTVDEEPAEPAQQPQASSVGSSNQTAARRQSLSVQEVRSMLSSHPSPG